MEKRGKVGRREERGRGEKTEEKRGEERGEIVSTQINDKIVTYSFSNYTDSVSADIYLVFPSQRYEEDKVATQAITMIISKQ